MALTESDAVFPYRMIVVRGVAGRPETQWQEVIAGTLPADKRTWQGEAIRKRGEGIWR